MPTNYMKFNKPFERNDAGMEAAHNFEITRAHYMRGEPIAGMGFRLIHGLRSAEKRKTLGQGLRASHRGVSERSHVPSRVSLGKGMLKENAASMKEFGGEGNVIYIINPEIAHSQTFRPNSTHPNNIEFVVKGVSPFMIQAIIAHNADFKAVQEELAKVEDLILRGMFPQEHGKDIEQQKALRLQMIRALPIISFEQQMHRER